MKKVYVIRHADKNIETGELTNEGRKRAKELKTKLPHFMLVIGSNRPRITETAELLTGVSPQLDKRAGFIYSSEEQNEKFKNLAKVHQLGAVGVIFENMEFEHLIPVIGNNLLELIKETLSKLPENGHALIVSQDGVMTAATYILQNKSLKKLDKTFKPLEGFIVNDDLTYQELDV